jgi:rubrerythrin
VAQVAYGNFIQQALDLDENEAAEHFTQSRDVEEGHANLYKSALNDLMEDRSTTYYVCSVCGYISDGFLPEVCPVCGAKKDQFVHFD